MHFFLNCKKDKWTHASRKHCKGQLISNGLFWYPQFFQKMNEKNRSMYYDMFLRLNCFRLFFGRIEDKEKDISKLIDLKLQRVIPCYHTATFYWDLLYLNMNKKRKCVIEKLSTIYLICFSIFNFAHHCAEQQNISHCNGIN